MGNRFYRPGWGFTAPLGWLLSPLALLYRLVSAARVLAYRRGWLPSHRAPTQVIAVGNLTAGGSGKTPLVGYLLQVARDAGVPTVCLSRGYRRTGRSDLLRVRGAEGHATPAGALGDEPAMLARRHPETAFYSGARRADTARLAMLWDAPWLMIADDAYQHLALARDLNVLLIDVRQGLGNEALLPQGLLREPLHAARRADVILLTKANQGDPVPLQRRLAALPGLRAPVFTAEYHPARLTRLQPLRQPSGSAADAAPGAQADPAPAQGAGQRTGLRAGTLAETPPEILPVESLRGRHVGALCGIAAPEGFARTLAGLGAEVTQRRTFPDHHDFTAAELAALDRALAEAPDDTPDWVAPHWVTTEKDAVKLRGKLRHGDRLWVLEMAVVPEQAARACFFDFIRGCRLD